MASKKKILYPVLFMVGLTVLYTFVLAFINESSAQRVAEQEALRVKRSVLYVFDIEHDGSAENINQLYEEKVEQAPFGDDAYYVFEENGAVTGYAFPFVGKGLWGSISGYLALSPDFGTVIGIDFVAHSETPGLGGRIDEDWFKEQFRNVPAGVSSPLVFRPSEGGSLDAITGATLTSKAVINIVNDFISEVLTFAKEANL